MNGMYVGKKPRARAQQQTHTGNENLKKAVVKAGGLTLEHGACSELNAQRL
jgi:Cu/Ag efflux protein CusF